jgi:hypothetical protein
MSAAHHGDGPQESELIMMLKEQREGTAQRKWPQGRLSGLDEGQIAFAIGPDESGKNVVIDFGKQVAWVAMTPEDAVQLAQMLIKHARAISPRPITIQLH